MGITDLWSRKKDDAGSLREVSLDELQRDYDIVEMVDEERGREFAIVTARSVHEIGTSSASPWTSFTRQEYNPLLMGLSGLEMFDKMRKSDGTVRGTVRAVKTPVLAGRWFIEPAEDTDEARKIAAMIWCNLTEYMSITWTQVLTESLLMLDFGYYMFEIVWGFQEIDGVMRTSVKKLAPRHPMDVIRWITDAHGGPVAVEMHSSNAEGKVVIPIDKLLCFTFDREAGNMEGISILRSAYKHWYYKEQLYKIDAIQKERHGIGIPIIKLPMGFKEKDRIAAENLGRNIRTNERAHIVLPPGWDIMMLKLEGNPVNCLESVEHHNEAIRENILVNFIGNGAREEDLVMFHKATRFVADIVAETFTTYLLNQMVAKNFPDAKKMPKLKVRRIGESADWRTLSFAMRNLIGAGVIIPDEKLEENLRDEMDLPMADHDSARLIATPQNPYDINEDIDDPEDGSQDKIDNRAGEGSKEDPIRNKNNPQYNRKSRGRKRGGKTSPSNLAGLPRQATVGNQKTTFKTAGRRSGGNDKSGG